MSVVVTEIMTAEALRIADEVVPNYRDENKSYSCTGHMAKRWGSAFTAAIIALKSVSNK